MKNYIFTFLSLLFSVTILYLLIEYASDLKPSFYWNPEDVSDSFRSILLSIVASLFAISGTVASTAVTLISRNKYKEAGLLGILRVTIRSTDFALSMLLFPFIFLLVIQAVLKSEDLILTLMFSFETGFVIKSFMEGFSNAKN